MCGIFGYIGDSNAPEIIHQGLKRLEYRGYDSWGISIINGDKIETIKDIGHIPEKIERNLKSTIGIGHTRWATHGGVTITNAHPHISSDKRFVIAQNGIVENYESLKNTLSKKGYIFNTQVDTEVILKLIEDNLKKNNDIRNAFIKAFKKLEGRNTVILLDSETKKIYAIRNGSPLILGVNKDNIYLASDPLAFNHLTKSIVEINNGELVGIEKGNFSIYDIFKEKEIKRKPKEEKLLNIDIDKGKYDHYMLKEIVEQQFTVLNVSTGKPQSTVCLTANNPFKDQLIVQSQKNCSVEVRDSNGRLTGRSGNHSKFHQFDTSCWQTGVYFIKSSAGNEEFVLKVVKSH